MNERKGVTLDELLASREQRWHKQMMLVHEHPTLTLLCLTVIMPGNVKRNAQSLVVAKAAVEAMREQFGESIHSLEESDLNTGYEAFLMTSLPLHDAKRLACHIEDTHPLGRLFDIDVIDRKANPLGRDTLGLPPRRCLLCDHEARYCMRNHSHTPQELQCHIDQMIRDYVQ